jgi:hypothetical protein
MTAAAAARGCRAIIVMRDKRICVSRKNITNKRQFGNALRTVSAQCAERNTLLQH